MIVAKGEGLSEYNNIMDIPEGNVYEEIHMQKPLKKQIYVRTYDAIKGEPLGGVIVKWRKKASRHISEGLTRKEGLLGYVIDENTTYVIEAEKKGYVNYYREVVMTKGNQKTSDVRVPMIPVELPLKQPSEADDKAQIMPKARYRIVLSSDYSN